MSYLTGPMAPCTLIFLFPSYTALRVFPLMDGVAKTHQDGTASWFSAELKSFHTLQQRNKNQPQTKGIGTIHTSFLHSVGEKRDGQELTWEYPALIHLWGHSGFWAAVFPGIQESTERGQGWGLNWRVGSYPCSKQSSSITIGLGLRRVWEFDKLVILLYRISENNTHFLTILGEGVTTPMTLPSNSACPIFLPSI